MSAGKLLGMGWKPTRSGGAGSSDGSASPPPRRRRRTTEEASATPLVDKAIKASPRVSTGARPRSGVNNSNPLTVERAGKDDRKRDVRVRLGKRWAEVFRDVKAGEYSWAEFVEGLDEDELARGQLRAEDGTFKGRPPSLVPREFLLACQRELRRRFEELFNQDVIKVAKQYLALAQSQNLKPEVQAKMLQYAMERVFGSIPKDVRVQTEAPWEQMFANVVRGEDDGIPDHLAERYARYAERQGGGRGEEAL